MYILTLILVLLFLVGATIYLFTGIISIFYKSPYVPTKDVTTRKILKKAKIKEKSTFYDLGAGDGRVVAIAQNEFNLQAFGFEANPLLCVYAKLCYNVTLKRENFFKTNLSDVDTIYVYLFPQLLAELAPKLQKECSSGTCIISNSFKITGLEDKLKKTLTIGNRNVYYYRI